MLRAALVRTVGQPDRIYVTRSDGTEVTWSFPTYGERLPHDLVHLVVESAFGLSRGFWGRVDEGADPKAINAEANRRGGRDKYAAFGKDQTELHLAEALAAAPWAMGDVADEELQEQVRATLSRHGAESPAARSAERTRETRAVLLWLAGRWRDLKPKGALNLTFDGRRPEHTLAQMQVEARNR